MGTRGWHMLLDTRGRPGTLDSPCSTGELEPTYSERNLTLHLKRMICVGAATLGVAAIRGVASASAATITEAGSSLVYPLVANWSHVYTADNVSAAAGGSGAGIADITRRLVQHRRLRRPDDHEPGSAGLRTARLRSRGR